MIGKGGIVDFGPFWDVMGRVLPFECFGPAELVLFRRTFVVLLLLAPALGLLGTQVVNARYAFFSDAVSHAVFAGVGLGALANAVLEGAGLGAWAVFDPRWSLPAFAAVFGVGVAALRRRGRLSADTAIGVGFALVTAAGLCLVHRFPDAAGGVTALVFGQSTGGLRDGDVLWAAALLAATFGFMAVAGNRLVLAGLDEPLARAHGIRTAAREYLFTALLAVVVAATARMAGVLLVTALLVVPGAAGRNWARSWRGQCWGSMAAATASVGAGYWLSLREDVNLPSGALAVLCAGALFGLSAATRAAGGGRAES